MRILIVRLSAMGDIIHAMPAVAGLRLALPDSEIHWAIEERWAALLTATPPDTSARLSPEQPLVNFVHRVHMRRWRQAPLSVTTYREMRALKESLRKQRYDIAIDLQGAIRSALLGKASGPRLRAGAFHPRELPARWWYTIKAQTAAQHVADQAAEVISAALGKSIQTATVPFPTSTEATRWAHALISEGPPFVVMNPGAGWGAKCWPAERYEELVSVMAGHGVRTFVNAGPGEAGLAARVCESDPVSAKVVQCTIDQLIALTRSALLFIGGDTGPLHLASALGVPVIAIFGPTDPARNGPYGGKSVVLRDPESRRDHTRYSRPEAGLLNITVRQVADAALRLLGVPA